MDINLEMIKQIISSDDLCDKVNSTEYRNSYIKQIRSYIVSLCDNASSVRSNITYINRYLRKFVCTRKNMDDIFFDDVLLKVYSFSIKNDDFDSILKELNFDGLKDLIFKRYDRVICGNKFLSNDDLVRMLVFYCYACPSYVLPLNYINYFTHYLVANEIILDYDLVCYYYKVFGLCFSLSKGLSVKFVISDSILKNDSDRNMEIVIYRNNIGNRVDYRVLADIFYQIKYLSLVNGIRNNRCYSFEQLRLVKEICLNSILGNSYFDSNYGDIRFSNDLRKQSFDFIMNYFRYLRLNASFDFDPIVSVSDDVDDNTDRYINIDVLFDVILSGENHNLLKGLIKSYPILGCEYRSDKRKSLLDLLLDIYNNRKMLVSFNKDLKWYKRKMITGDSIYLSKIKRLNRKIMICSNCIDVMSLSISNGSMTSIDLLRSISDLITYNTVDCDVQNDIYFILSSVVPRIIKELCFDRSVFYREQFKKRVIKCYLDSMGSVRNDFDSVYLMRVYSSLEICVKAFDID